MTLRRNRWWFAAFCIDIVFSIQSNAADAYNLGGARSSVPNGAGSQIEPVRWCYTFEILLVDMKFITSPTPPWKLLLYCWLPDTIDRHLEGNSRLVVIKDAGHAVNLEKPKEVCKNIIEFFKEPAAEAANGDDKVRKTLHRSLRPISD